jgi:hypothetical protein
MILKGNEIDFWKWGNRIVKEIISDHTYYENFKKCILIDLDIFGENIPTEETLNEIFAGYTNWDTVANIDLKNRVENSI